VARSRKFPQQGDRVVSAPPSGDLTAPDGVTVLPASAHAAIPDRAPAAVVSVDDITWSSSLAIEQAFVLLRQRPSAALELIGCALRGPAQFRRFVDARSSIDPAVLPYQIEILDQIRQVQAESGNVQLASHGMPRAAATIAAHLGLFGGIIDDDAARTLVPLQRPLYRMSYARALARTLRVHQWAKNLLLFIPLIASHRFDEGALVRDALLAFVAFSACASSVYLLNDLLDLPDDRRHPSKRHRPLAEGSFPAGHALLLGLALLTAAIALSVVCLPVAFVMSLAVYYVLTLSYSLSLKRIVMVDVIVLATLYTIRVIAGALATAQVATFWLLAFCVFIFLSLAFLKRYTELWLVLQHPATEQTWGRGYKAADFELLASLGGAAGYISVLVLALYINDASSAALYRSPQWLWPACLLLLFWLSRAWLLAHRGQMPDDPIVFALSDNVSRWLGLGFIAIFAVASFA
jgi:4-hydroxybenzoate polyprenyltransferase